MPSTKDHPWLRLLRRILFGALVLLFLYLIACYAISFHAQKRAEHLLSDLETLKVGTSTADDALRIVERYGGYEFSGIPEEHNVAPWGIGPCSGPHQRYGIYVAPDLVSLSVFAVPILQQLGFHAWSLSSTIDIKDRKVLCVSQSISFQRSDGHEIKAQAEMLPDVPSLANSPPYTFQSHFIRRYIHEVAARVLPRVSAEEKTRAFRIDLSCLTSFGGCVLPCQLAPAVWEDLSQEGKKEGWAIEGDDDPHCQQVLRRP